MMRFPKKTDNGITQIAQETGTPKVSVIIPVYNTEQYVKECLDSVTGQTQREIEILCVNDGSSDLTPEILREYAAKDLRITVIDQPNRGVSAARNAGLDRARGEYICFLDSDDLLDTDALEILTAEADGKNTDILFFDRTRFYEEESLRNRFPELLPRQDGFGGVYTGTELMTRLRSEGKYYHNATMALFKRSFLQGAGLRFHEDVTYAEDLLFTFSAMMKAKRTSCCGRELYHYRIHPNSSMTSPVIARRFESYGICFREILRFGILEAETFEEKEETAFELEKVRRLCVNDYRKLPDTERDRIEFSDRLDAFLFDRLLAGMNEEKLKRRCDTLQRSRSYRLGRALTWLPRKIRKGSAALTRRIRNGKDS